MRLWLGARGGRDGNGLAIRLRGYWKIIGLIEAQCEQHDAVIRQDNPSSGAQRH
jgi:hypothetical protein